MTKFFLDTKFIEDGKTIDLISIGIVCEDGSSYYAMSKYFDPTKASDWIVENVLKKLPPLLIDSEYDFHPDLFADNRWQPDIIKDSKTPNEVEVAKRLDSLYWRSPKDIALEVVRFIKKRCVDHSGWSNEEYCTIFNNKDALWALELDQEPEIWGYYADYDWVVLCQLFGTMMDLPKGFPMYCRDLKQECDRLGNPRLPEQEVEHNALADAYWNKKAWEFLRDFEVSESIQEIDTPQP